MKLSFEWHLRTEKESGISFVLERLAGTDLFREYGPMPTGVTSSFIRARRDIVSRLMTDIEARRIFEPQPLPLKR